MRQKACRTKQGKRRTLTNEQIIKQAIAEDVGAGDVTTLAIVPADKRTTAKIFAKENLVLAGLDIARDVFYQFDNNIIWQSNHKDGEHL